MSSNNPYENNTDSQLRTFFNKNEKILWCYFEPISTPTLTIGLLKSIRKLQDQVAQNYFGKSSFSPNSIVWDSVFDSIFCLGIDLEYIVPLLKSRNETKLAEYFDLCADVLFLNYVNLELPITTFSYLRNRAYGAGFDALVSSDIIIAEKKARCGYPALKKGLLDSGALGLIQRRFNNSPLLETLCKGDIINHKEMSRNASFKLIEEGDTIVDVIKNYSTSSCLKPKISFNENLLSSMNKNSLGLTRAAMMPYKRLWLKNLLDIPYDRYNELYKIISIQKYLHKKCYNSNYIR